MDLNACDKSPIIGITTYLQRAKTGVWDNIAAYLPEQYFSLFSELGGGVLLLPPQPASTATVDAIMQRIDGLIIVGGHDIDPELYGQSRHPRTDSPKPDRDAWDLALARAAVSWDKPFLGICRGAQIMNVAFGGTLIQHLPDVVRHQQYQLGDGQFSHMDVLTVQESLIHTIVGERTEVAMYHHQAIDQLGQGLRATAHTSEGVIQAIENPGMTFGLSVQWHPEETLDDSRLFQAFYKQALENSKNPQFEL